MLAFCPQSIIPINAVLRGGETLLPVDLLICRGRHGVRNRAYEGLVSAITGFAVNSRDVEKLLVPLRIITPIRQSGECEPVRGEVLYGW